MLVCVMVDALYSLTQSIDMHLSETTTENRR